MSLKPKRPKLSAGARAAKSAAKASMASTASMPVPPYTRSDQVPYGTPGKSTAEPNEIKRRK